MVRMDEPREPQPNPFASGDAWADAPLLREIHRVLLSSTGPVNWELARQIGIASASWGGDDPVPTEDDRRAFEEAVRVAELKVQAFTGLERRTTSRGSIRFVEASGFRPTSRG